MRVLEGQWGKTIYSDNEPKNHIFTFWKERNIYRPRMSVDNHKVEYMADIVGLLLL